MNGSGKTFHMAGACTITTIWLVQMAGPNGWSKWLVQMTGPNDWSKWLVQMAGPNGWSKWLAQMAGPNAWPNGWSKWLVQMAGPNGWSQWLVLFLLEKLSIPRRDRQFSSGRTGFQIHQGPKCVQPCRRETRTMLATNTLCLSHTKRDIQGPLSTRS